VKVCAARLARVHADVERLGERGNVERHPARHREHPRAEPGIANQKLRREPAFLRAVTDATELVVARMHHDAVASLDAGDVGTDPVDHARDLVPERHRFRARPCEPAVRDVTEIGAADAAGRNAHDDVARSGCGRRDVVDAHVVRAVHPDLAHYFQPCFSANGCACRVRPRHFSASALVSIHTATRPITSGVVPAPATSSNSSPCAARMRSV